MCVYVFFLLLCRHTLSLQNLAEQEVNIKSTLKETGGRGGGGGVSTEKSILSEMPERNIDCLLLV